MSSSLLEVGSRAAAATGAAKDRIFERLADALVIVGINLETPLVPLETDGASASAAAAAQSSADTAAAATANPFSATFGNFVVLDAITGHSRAHLPAGAELTAARGRPDLTVPSGVLDALPMFCFPGGSRVMSHDPGPAMERMHSFAVKEGGYYATCFTYYQRVEAHQFMLAWECLHPREKQQQEVQEGNETAGGGNGDSAALTHVYMPRAACLVSRGPHWGVMRDTLVALSPLLSGHFDDTMPLEAAVAFLTAIPVPLAGPVQLRFRVNREVITWRPPPASAPRLSTSLRLLLRILAPEHFARLLLCLMLERRCVFFSRDIALLTPAMEATLAALYPFEWQHVYIPVLPSHLRSVIEMPWPYFVGLDSIHLEDIRAMCRDAISSARMDASETTPSPIIVDLDAGVVEMPENEPLPPLPEAPVELFVSSCRTRLVPYERTIIGQAVVEPELDTVARQAHNEQIERDLAAATLELMIALFGQVRAAIVFDLTPPIFNVDAFLSGQKPVHHEFYRAIFDTGSFRTFKKSRQPRDLDMFDLAASGQFRMHAGTSAGGGALRIFVPTPRPPGRVTRSPSLPLVMMGGGNSEAVGTVKTTVTGDDGLLLVPRTRSSESPGSPDLRVAGDIAGVMIASLTNRLDSGPEQGSAAWAQLLHLRAVYYISRSEVVPGMQDLDALYKACPLLFPVELVRSVLASMDQAEMMALQATGFYRASELWSRFALASKAPAAEDNVSGLVLPEIGSYDSVLSAVQKKDTIEAGDFNAIARLLGIAVDEESASNLYQALLSFGTDEDGDGSSVFDSATPNGLKVEMLSQFLEMWHAVGRNHDYHLAKLVKLHPGESVLKVAPLVRISDIGFGTLVLTHERLFLVQDDSTANLVVSLADVVSLDKVHYKVIIPPGVPAIRVTSSESNAKRTKKKKASLRAAVAAGSKEHAVTHTLVFFNDRDAWHSYIMEMVMGHQVALGTGDPKMILKAARHIELAETVSKVSSYASCSPKKPVKRSLRRKSSTADLPQVKRMLPFSNPATPQKGIGTPTRRRTSERAIVKRVDITPGKSQKVTVEFLVHVPMTNSLWCGLGSGEIQILSASTYELESRIKSEHGRVTSMLLADNTVWVAFFSCQIQVLDASSRHSVALMPTSDIVTSFWCDAEANSVWCTTLNGDVVQWDIATHAQMSIIPLGELLEERIKLMSVVRLDSRLWCGCNNIFVVYDLKKRALVPLSAADSQLLWKPAAAHHIICGLPNEVSYLLFYMFFCII